MSLTITIPGAVEATIGATAPAVLTIGVGTPGATGPAGPGVPAGGLTAQFLQKTSNTSYATDWVTLPAYLPLAGGTMNVNAAIDFSDTTTGTVSEVGGYGMAVSSASNAALYSNVLFDRILVANATGATILKPTGVEFPDLTLQTTAGISAATAATTYAPIAAGLPTGGTVGQVLTKNSGTNFDASFATLIPGDRYLTTSSTSNTVSNGAKTFTVGTGLSYTPTQNLTIAYDASHHMHGEVLTYDSGTGVLTVDINNHTGTGTYSSWVVNVGGVTPVASVAWGDILGVIGNQGDLAAALGDKLEVTTAASTYYPLVGNPSSFLVAADITGKANLASPSLTGTPLSTTAAVDTNTTQIATTAFVVGQAGSATPLVNGTAAVGTSLRYARADHVHGTDTTRAPLASPTFTGTVTIPVGASISGFAPLASPTFTGTPTLPTGTIATTQTAGNSTTAVATTAFVTTAGNLKANLASPTFTGTPTLPTGTIATTQTAGNSTTAVATTAFVTTAGNLKANLASPTFTGTPTLPTGTIATTQTAGNNTTAVATTAFVTAAVPSFATTAEMASPSSTTKVVAPNDVVRMIVNRATFDTQNSSPTFATSGAGATAYKLSNDRALDIGTPNILTAGYGQMIYDTNAAAWGLLGAKRGDSYFTQDWSKRIWMSGTHTFIAMGDASTTAYCMLGGRSSVTTGDPTKQAIGWKLLGGSTALKLITYGYDGSALVVTETASSFTPVVNQSFDWMIVHAPNPANAATSYCYLYVNDALVATGINAPADATVNYNWFYHSFESTVTATARMDAIVFPTKVWWSRS